MKKIFPSFLFSVVLFSSCNKTELVTEETKTVIDTGSPSAERINQTVTNGGTVSNWVGYDMDIDFNYAIIGDPGYNTPGADKSGAAYIYTREVSGNTWRKVQAIKQPNGIAYDNFGIEVAIDGINAVSCTNDSLYAFQRQPTGKWLLTQVFLPPNLPAEGISVSCIDIDGDHMIIGHASHKQGSLWGVGAVYFYKLVNNVWIFKNKFTAPTGAEYGWFGTDVSIHGNYALVGSRGEDREAVGNPPGNVHGGRAYVYVRSGDSWSRQASIIPPDNVIGDLFGQYVALYENTAVISAPEAYDGKGMVYVYRRSGTSWTRDVSIISPNFQPHESFGRGIALNKNYLVVGGGSFTGAIYFFNRFGLSYYYSRTETSPLPNPSGFGAKLAMDSTQHYLVGQNGLGSFHFGTVN